MGFANFDGCQGHKRRLKIIHVDSYILKRKLKSTQLIAKYLAKYWNKINHYKKNNEL